MTQRNQKGFTLIELLIVVAIIGIIAAIAIPNFLSAADRGKQKRTMADMRSVSAAIESYSVDQGAYPAAADMRELAEILSPAHIMSCPQVDGWGNALGFERSSTGGYLLRSRGKDGVPEIEFQGGSTGDYDCDIILVDGEFTQWPEGMQH